MASKIWRNSGTELHERNGTSMTSMMASCRFVAEGLHWWSVLFGQVPAVLLLWWRSHREWLRDSFCIHPETECASDHLQPFSRSQNTEYLSDNAEINIGRKTGNQKVEQKEWSISAAASFTVCRCYIHSSLSPPYSQLPRKRGRTKFCFANRFASGWLVHSRKIFAAWRIWAFDRSSPQSPDQSTTPVGMNYPSFEFTTKQLSE